MQDCSDWRIAASRRKMHFRALAFPSTRQQVQWSTMHAATALRGAMHDTGSSARKVVPEEEACS